MFGIPTVPAQDPPMIHYRNRTLAQPFRLRERLRTGKPMYGSASLLGETESSRIMAQCGFDFIFLDWEHTSTSKSKKTLHIKT